MSEAWHPENLEAINQDIEFALSADGEEADAAAVRAFRSMRRFGLGIRCLGITEYGVAAEDAKEREVGEAELQNVKISFGKYKGRPLLDILKSDAKYFWWLANKANIQSPELAEAVEAIWSRRESFGVT